ncbi:hypothetical protein KAT24_01305 [Candidatus Pacearchaeota archaeon]|nr:hypothetical protein [Candidatus Pacearchaeota archaeon]
MIKKQKKIFLYAFLLTFVVFNFGIFMGYMLETSRVSEINILYLEAEMELLDQRIQKDALDLIELDCELLVQENIDFADRIFQEALLIQKYEDANRMNENIIFQHKRYDLLRTLFWINSIRIKQKCGSDYHNLVYFYQFNDPSIKQDSKQRFFSNLLIEIKEEYGNKVMLIPISGDNDLPSISLLLNKYEIIEFPTILIDENIKITDLETKEDITKYLF